MTSNAKTAFFQAIDNGDVGSVRKMIEQTPSLLGEVDEFGCTALMRAVSSMERTSELVQVLINAGADVNATTADGYTALHMMIDVNGTTGTGKIPGQIARLLIDAGAEIEARQHWGWTPLMRAAVEGTTDELKALVDVGANVNHIFPDHTMPEFLCGRTTLMATVGKPEKTQILIDAGADVAATDAHGETTLAYAQACLIEGMGNGTDMYQIKQDLIATTMMRTFELMKKAGINPEDPIDSTGKTWKQSCEEASLSAFSTANQYDYCVEVRKTIAIIEKALANY